MKDKEEKIFSGMQKMTTIDYPGNLAAVVFASGCCCQCPYCHNMALNTGEIPATLSESNVLSFLKDRQGKLTGVVLSGGEPLMLDPDQLTSLVAACRSMGYAVKLDTCGLPAKMAWGVFDMVAIDVKAPRAKYKGYLLPKHQDQYEQYMGNLSYNLEKLLLVDCFEVRTTVHKKLLSFDDLMQLKKDWLTEEHVDNWYLQQYHEAECYDSTLNHTETYSNAELSDMANALGAKIRGI